LPSTAHSCDHCPGEIHAAASQSASPRGTAFILGNSLLLPIGSAIGLISVNQCPESVSDFVKPVHSAVNDVGMTLFFAWATKEIVEARVDGRCPHSRAAGPYRARPILRSASWRRDGVAQGRSQPE
jgi:hypothetical protein